MPKIESWNQQIHAAKQDNQKWVCSDTEREDEDGVRCCVVAELASAVPRHGASQGVRDWRSKD